MSSFPFFSISQLAITMASILLVQDSKPVSACSFQAHPQNVQAGRPCHILWDQTKNSPSNNSGYTASPVGGSSSPIFPGIPSPSPSGFSVGLDVPVPSAAAAILSDFNPQNHSVALPILSPSGNISIATSLASNASNASATSATHHHHHADQNNASDAIQWGNTSITLMEGNVGSGSSVAVIAVNINMSQDIGTYNIPQAPYLTCYGHSYYYELGSATGTILFTDVFTITEENAVLSSNCTSVAVTVKNYGAYYWGPVNDYIYGYTLIQNVTNVYNNVETTLVQGQSTTTTLLTTITQVSTVPAATITQLANVIPTSAVESDTSAKTKTQTVVSTVTATSPSATSYVVTHTSYTILHSGPYSPQTSTAAADATGPSSVDAFSGAVSTSIPSSSRSADADMALEGSATPSAAVSSTPSSPTSTVACSGDQWDAGCDDWSEDSHGGSSISVSASASASAGSNSGPVSSKAEARLQGVHAFAILVASATLYLNYKGILDLF